MEVLLDHDWCREQYPAPVRVDYGRWRDAKTGQIITDLVVGWRLWPHGAASKRPILKKRGPTPKLDHAFEQLLPPEMTRRERKTVILMKITEAYAERGPSWNVTMSTDEFIPAQDAHDLATIIRNVNAICDATRKSRRLR